MLGFEEINYAPDDHPLKPGVEGWPVAGELAQRPWGTRVFDPDGRYLRINERTI